MDGLMLSVQATHTRQKFTPNPEEATMVLKFTTSVRRSGISARQEINRSMLSALHQGGAALAGYRDDPQAAEQVVRTVAAGAALLATLLRARAGGASVAGYQHRRAGAEQLIRDISAVSALLALALRRPRTTEPAH